MKDKEKMPVKKEIVLLQIQLYGEYWEYLVFCSGKSFS